MTLPRGPIESQQSWYAGSRLGIYILTTILWGASGPPVAHLYVGRCKEKSAPYSMYCFRQLLSDHMDLSQVEDLTWWSDGGRHFRATVPISTMLVNGMAALCSRSEIQIPHEVQVNFGVPAHFKNTCDGAQAHARHGLDEMARTQ